MKRRNTPHPEKPRKRVVKTTVDVRKALEELTERKRLYTERLKTSCEFQQIIDHLVTITASHAVLHNERQAMVDEDLAEQCRAFAARLAFVGCNGTASAGEIAYVLRLIELGWRSTPVYSEAPDGSLVARIPNAKKTAPWMIALCTIFHQRRFAARLLRVDGRSDDQRAFDAVAHLFRELRATCLPLPPVFLQVIPLIRGAPNVDGLPSPAREQVKDAMRFMGSLARSNEDGILTFFRIRSAKARGRTISPWRAALEFAACFQLTMPDRVHEAARKR